jgi:stage III sporulation protein AA
MGNENVIVIKLDKAKYLYINTSLYKACGKMAQNTVSGGGGVLAALERKSTPRGIKEKIQEEILSFLPANIRSIIQKLDAAHFFNLEEIRLRAGKPLMLVNSFSDFFIDSFGRSENSAAKGIITKQEDLLKTLELMSENSVYAYMDEIKSGFITLRGGHRVGIAGKVVLSDGRVKNIKDISGLNIRIAREIPGCSAGIIRYLVNRDGSFCNTLIISPPGCGKTTILRDLARVLGNGSKEFGIKGAKVGIVDERSEIAACYRGIPQFDVGLRTDVLDGCPKTVGMPIMIRSMSPQIIITDEIGNLGDTEAILNVLNAGVKIITSAHGYNVTSIGNRREIKKMMEQGIFERYVCLGCSEGPGTVEEILDGVSMKLIYRRGYQ